jgi:hypothetical protein
MATIMVLASLEHPRFSPADQTGGECEWGAGVRNANGLKRRLFGRVAPATGHGGFASGRGRAVLLPLCAFPWPIAFACAAAYYTLLLLLVNQLFNQCFKKKPILFLGQKNNSLISILVN